MKLSHLSLTAFYAKFRIFTNVVIPNLKNKLTLMRRQVSGIGIQISFHIIKPTLNLTTKITTAKYNVSIVTLSKNKKQN